MTVVIPRKMLMPRRACPYCGERHRSFRALGIEFVICRHATMTVNFGGR